MGEEHYSGRKCSRNRLTVSADNTGLVWWDYHSGNRLGISKDIHSDVISKLALSRDDTLLVTASDDKTLKLWKIPQLKDGKLQT